MIKNATIRKIRNRGLTPIQYRAPDGVYYGYVEKRGRKWMHLVCGTRKFKVLLDEEKFIKEL